MDKRIASVQSICAESVTIEADFGVAVGELAISEDGQWFGVVQSHKRDTVRLLPLELPKFLKSGSRVVFTGESLEERLGRVEWGNVVDTLGRHVMKVSDAAMGRETVSHIAPAGNSIWGLKSLGEYMELHEGEGVALIGTPPGGFPLMFAGIAASQRADSVILLCQGGYRDLYRYCRALRKSGRAENSVVLWVPPWLPPASKSLASRSMMILSRNLSGKGKRLILIDDVHYWLESLREYGESSGEPLLPDGYPYTARRQLAEILDLKQPVTADGNSTSMIVGWRYQEGFFSLVEHPYMARLPRFMRTGIVLEESAESLIPAAASWGKSAPVGRVWKKLNHEYAVGEFEEDVRRAVDSLKSLFGVLFVEYSPISSDFDNGENVPFDEECERMLYKRLENADTQFYEDVLKLRGAVLSHYREGIPARRHAFINWLFGGTRKDEEV